MGCLKQEYSQQVLKVIKKTFKTLDFGTLFIIKICCSLKSKILELVAHRESSQFQKEKSHNVESSFL